MIATGSTSLPGRLKARIVLQSKWGKKEMNSEIAKVSLETRREQCF